MRTKQNSERPSERFQPPHVLAESDKSMTAFSLVLAESGKTMSQRFQTCVY